MSHPRISIFASSANGNALASRVIEGRETLQARTSHDISIDTIHDELAVPNPFALALLFFRGGANGNEAPIRVIQGSKTLLNYPDNITVDPIHDEVFTAQFFTDAVLVYRRDVGGDVAPIRIIHGPKTRLDRPSKVTVDPVNNLLAVSTVPGLWIFDRTANGDVAPKWVLAGPKTGLGGTATGKAVFYPEGKKILVGGGRALGTTQSVMELLAKAGVTGASATDENKPGIRYFIGVWKYGDNGDIPPWAVLNGTPTTQIKHGRSMTIIPEAKELMSVSAGKLVVHYIPEIFEKE